MLLHNTATHKCIQKPFLWHLYGEISHQVLTHRGSSLQWRLYLNILRSLFFFPENLPVNLLEKVASRQRLTDRASCVSAALLLYLMAETNLNIGLYETSSQTGRAWVKIRKAWWLRLEINLIQTIQLPVHLLISACHCRTILGSLTFVLLSRDW